MSTPVTFVTACRGLRGEVELPPLQNLLLLYAAEFHEDYGGRTIEYIRLYQEELLSRDGGASCMSDYLIPHDLARRGWAVSRAVASLVFSSLLFAVTAGFSRPATAGDGDINASGETNLGDLVLLYQFVTGSRMQAQQGQ